MQSDILKQQNLYIILWFQVVLKRIHKNFVNCMPSGFVQLRKANSLKYKYKGTLVNSKYNMKLGNNNEWESKSFLVLRPNKQFKVVSKRFGFHIKHTSENFVKLKVQSRVSLGPRGHILDGEGGKTSIQNVNYVMPKIYLQIK